MSLSFQNKKVIATRHGRPSLFGGIFVLVMLTSMSVGADETGTRSAAPMEKTAPLRLNALSQQLISQVKQGTAEATRFRSDVVYYRESLRSLMLANENVDQPHRLENSLLMQMVRMAALLQSAAECQTGRYISCPANLVIELDRQQLHLTRALTDSTNSP